MPLRNAMTVGNDRSLYTGEIPATDWHAHAAPVLLIGLSGRFALHHGEGRLDTCRSALVAAGVWHRFDPLGETVALMYLEPDAPEARGLLDALGVGDGVLFDVAMPVGARATTDAYLRHFDVQSLLRWRLPPGRPLDPRVARSLQALRAVPLTPLSRAGAAGGVHLSVSRFNHLFSQEMGVSFRSYRVWSQVRHAVAAWSVQARMTQVALDAAFADSAHFSRVFRQTFGMTPSSVLKPLGEVTVLK